MNLRRVVRPGCFLAASIVFLQFCGCAGGYRVETNYDDDGSTTNTTVGNELWVVGGTKDYPTENTRTIEKQCFLDLKRCEDVSGSVSFCLVFEYVGLEVMNFDSNSPLDLIIDERPLTVSEGIGGRHYKDGQHFVDYVEYPVHPSVLQRLAVAEEVKIVISGEFGDLMAYFRDDNLVYVRKFVDEFIETEK